jgi:hypothetical protein
MTAPLTYLKVFLLFSTSILLIACHSSSSTDPAIPDINTFHIYTSDQTIYSFNEDTRLSTKRGEFDSGNNKFLELNTDETKQGYEYAIYVYENAIYLMNYDKESNGQTIKLAQVGSSQAICSIIPHMTSSKAGFSDKIASNRSTLNLPKITIEYPKKGGECDPEFNQRDTLDFASVLKDPTNNTSTIRTLGRSENVIGSLIIDYNSTTIEPLKNTTHSYNQTGFLGQDLSGNKLVFKYTTESKDDQWETSFYPSTGIQTIHQASNKHVVVRNDQDVFILDSASLFKINNDAAGSTPVQEKLDALFSNSALENLDTNNSISFNKSQNEDSFLLMHDNTLYYYSLSKFNQIPSNETQAAQNAIKTKFDLTKDNTALVIQQANNLQTLLAISTVSGQSQTIISASKIEFYIIDNEFYVNTYESEAKAGWQAHWFRKVNSTYISSTYDHSRFVFSKDLRQKRNSIYLLSSNDKVDGSNIIKPALYAFDNSQNNGRKKGRDENNNTVDFSFGSLNTNVSDVVSSVISNDIYGKIVLKGINEDNNIGQAVEEHYYFNPSQDISKEHLLLMSRKVL